MFVSAEKAVRTTRLDPSETHNVLHNTLNLDINLTKTKIIQLRRYQKPPLNINFSYNQTQIENVDAFN